MKPSIIYFVLSFAVGTLNLAYSSECGADFCNNLSSKTPDEITSSFLDKLYENKYDYFFKLLDGIRGGDKDCFRAGVIIGKNSRQFGANTASVIDAFANLADREPAVFKENNKLFPMPDGLLVEVFSIPDWKFSKTKMQEIKETISHRKSYIRNIISDENILNELFKNYKVSEEELVELSRRELEHFQKAGVRLVFSSRYPSLVSDKEYSLKNLVDDNPNTAWCILGDYKKNDWGNILVKLDLNQINTDKFNCRSNKGSSKKNECYIEALGMNIRPGYQKSKLVFENNSRPEEITNTIRFDNVNNKHFKNTVTLSNVDADLEKHQVRFPIRQWVSTSFNPIKLKINFEKVKAGKKFREMCISDINIELHNK